MTIKTKDQTTWQPIQGATTAPIGYHWESNGKSRFGGEYEAKLVKDTDTQPLHYDINAITDDMVAAYASKKCYGTRDARNALIKIIEEEATMTGKTYTAEEVAEVFAEIMNEGTRVDEGACKYKVMVKSPKGTTAIETTSFWIEDGSILCYDPAIEVIQNGGYTARKFDAHIDELIMAGFAITICKKGES